MLAKKGQFFQKKTLNHSEDALKGRVDEGKKRKARFALVGFRSRDLQIALQALIMRLTRYRLRYESTDGNRRFF